MPSHAQYSANRANSLLSTGPRTPEGKAISSMNNLKLGLAARTFAVLETEDQDDFDNYVRDLLTEYDPQTTMESTLVRKVAQHHWLSQRAFFAEQMLFTDTCLPETQEDERRLNLLLRYQSHHDRAFHTSRRELDKVQTARRQRDSAPVKTAATQPRAQAEQKTATTAKRIPPPIANAPAAPPASAPTQPANVPAVPINKAA